MDKNYLTIDVVKKVANFARAIGRRGWASGYFGAIHTAPKLRKKALDKDLSSGESPTATPA